MTFERRMPSLIIAALVSSHDDSIPNIIVLIKILILPLMFHSAKLRKNIDKKEKDPNLY